VHLFVDGDEAAMAHKLKGSFKLGPLKEGNRKVCVSPVNKNHTPIGAQACINVTVQWPRIELENVIYGGVQLVHNFGAAAVTGLPIAALWFKPAAPVLRKMAWLTLLARLLQAASGIGFGTVSYFMEGELPEIHHLARAALYVKIGCAALAITLLAGHFARRLVLSSGQALRFSA